VKEHLYSAGYYVVPSIEALEYTFAVYFVFNFKGSVDKKDIALHCAQADVALIAFAYAPWHCKQLIALATAG
jgi:hypothetical protein